LKSQGCDTDFWEHPVLSEDFLVVFYVNSPQSPIFISEDFTLLLEELYPEKQLSNNDVIRLFTYIKGRADDYKARGVEHDLRTVAIEELYYIMRDKLSDEGISDRVKSKIRDMLKHRCITVSGASKRDSLYDCELYRKISDDLTEMASKEKDEEKKKLIDEILRNLEKAAECHSEAVVFFEKGDEKTAEAKIKEYAEIMKYFIIPGVEGSGRKFKKFLRMVEDLNVYGDDLTKAVKEHKAWVKRRMHLVEGDYDFSSLQHSYKFNPKKNLFTVEGVSIKVKPSIVDEDSLFEETGLILDKPTLKMLSAIFRAYKYGNRVLVLSGLTGIGKTFTLQAFAKMIDAEFYGEPTHKGSDIDKLAGIVKSDKDGDFYLEDDTKFLEAASKDAKGRDHGYVIALSELNAKVARDGSAALAWWMVPFARGDDPILLTEHPRPPPSDGEIFETLNVNKGCFIGIDINPKEGGYAARGTLPAALSEIVPAINVNESLDKDDVKLFIDTYFKRQAKDSARLSAISVLATKVFTDIQEMINEKIIATKRKDILSKRDLKRFCDDMLKNYSEKEIAGVFKRALYFNFLARFPGEDRRMVRALIDKEVELCKDIRKVTKDGEPIISPLNDVQGDGKGMSADLVVKDSRAFRDEDFETPRDYPFSLSPDENAEIVSEDLDIDELEHILKEHERGVYTVSVLNDGRILTSERGFTIRIWDLKGKKVYKLFKGTQFLSSDVLPDGRAVLGDNTGKVWVWDLENETARVFKIGGSGYVASNVLALPDGRIVAVYHQKGGDTGNAYMYLWDITPGEEKLTEIDNSGLKIKTVARFPDRDNSIIVGYDVKDPMDPAVGVWDLDTKEIIFLKHPGLKGAHAVSGVPDDPNKVVSGHIDGSIWIWDIDKAERTDTVDYRNLQVHDGCVRSLIALEGGKIISGGDDKKVKITQLSDPDAGQMSKTQTMNIHEGAVEFLACDPRDPNRFLSGSSDGTVKIWRAKVSAALKILRGHKQKIYTAAYNPDGTKIVTASDDKTAKIWNAETGVELKTLEGHKSEVRYAAFSPDGKKVMTAGADWNVKIWDAETGEEKRTIECEAGSLCSAAFSPDGKQILAAGIRPNQQGIQIATIRMFNAETGEKIGNPIMQKASHLTAVFSPDGTKIATAGFKEITGGGLIGAAKIWDARTGKELQNLGNTGAAFNSIAFSPDGTKVVTTSEEATLTIWDVETGEELKKLGLEDLETFIAFAAFSPDGTKIVTAGKDKEGTGAVRILDAETLTTKLILKDHRDLVRFASFSPDGTRVVTASNDRTARTYDIRPRSKRKYIGQTKPLEKSGEEKIKLEENEIEVKTESYGKEFLVKRFFTPEVDKDAKITEEKDANGEVVAKIIDEGSEVWEFVSLPDGKIAYIKGKDVKVWDPGTDRVLVLKGCKDPIGRICALPDGRIVTSSSVDCRLMIWNINEEGVEKSTVIETGGILRSDIVAMKALPDGRIAVATEKDITLVTAKDDRIETRSFLPHKTNFTRSIDVTPDGRSLVSTTDLDIYIWDVENIGKDKIKRQQVRIQNGSEIVVKNNMCFLTDGKIVTTYLEKRLSGSEDIHELTARVLDLKEKKMTTWSGSAEYISDIAGISNKGIISVAGDPAGDLKGAIPVRLWDLWKGTATLYDLLDESAMGIIRTSDGRIAMRFDKRIKLNMVPVAGVREEELTDEELDEEAVRQALETDRPTLVFYNVESDYTGFVEKIA
ncbi:MAG: WD40 repeat domain-containing protein, partial [Candidatus Omnitrophota bacterium]